MENALGDYWKVPRQPKDGRLVDSYARVDGVPRSGSLLNCASVWATDGLSPDMSWRMEIIYSVRGALIAAFGN